MSARNATRPEPAAAPPKRGLSQPPRGSSPPVADKAWLVYDGECPACRNYARLLDARESVGELILVNAREGGAVVDEIRRLGYDLNEGMVLKMNGRRYFGADALNVLASLSARRGVFCAVNRALFTSPRAARLGYPLMKALRRALLKVLGKKRLG